MGRTKGQVEKLDLAGASADDLRFLLCYGVNANKDRFLEVREIYDWLQSSTPKECSDAGLSDSEREDLQFLLEELIKGLSLELITLIEQFELELEALEIQHQERVEIQESIEALEQIFASVSRIQDIGDPGRCGEEPPSISESPFLIDIDEVTKSWDTKLPGELQSLPERVRKENVPTRPEDDESGRKRRQIGGPEPKDETHQSQRVERHRNLRDPRSVVFGIYEQLCEELGRRPFRKELEEACAIPKSRHGKTAETKSESRAQVKSKANSTIIQRMGLLLGDSRIHAELTASLTRDREALRSSNILDWAAHCRHFLERTKIRSPESERLKKTLRESPFDRLLEILDDERIAKLVFAHTDTVTYRNGAVYKPSKSKRLDFKRRRDMKTVRSINGSTAAFDLLRALFALSKVWPRVKMWGIDYRWLKTPIHYDYREALAFLFLSHLIPSPPRSASKWLGVVSNIHIGKHFIREVWILENMAGSPIESAEEVERGREALLKFFSQLPSDNTVTKCGDLVGIVEGFSCLLDFVEPFDTMQKMLDYGFSPPQP